MGLAALLALPVIGDIAKGLFGTIDNVIDKIAGDKMNETDKEKLKAEVALEFGKMDFTMWEKTIDDQIDARALAKIEAEKAPWVTRVFNGVIRPYGGFGALTVFFYTVIYKHLGQFLKIELAPIELVDWQWIILLSIIGFFFGLREVSKIKGVSSKS